jgi:hypothetical protein
MRICGDKGSDGPEGVAEQAGLQPDRPRHGGVSTMRLEALQERLCLCLSAASFVGPRDGIESARLHRAVTEEGRRQLAGPPSGGPVCSDQTTHVPPESLGP